MSRLTVTIDDDIIMQAKTLLHTRTKRDTIETALREIIKQKKREEALTHAGTIDLDIDQEGLQEYREQR